MILCIQNVLAPDVLGEVNAALEAAAFVEGRVTASEHAKLVKNNLQIDERSTCHAELSKTLSCAVLANGLFQLAVWPRTLFPFRVSRYDAGMGYGEHVDDPLFQGNRSDVSMTVFLSDPESYEGGELVIQWGGLEKGFKLAAGDMVVYPSTTLHRVQTVTRGTRLVAVSWAQSYIRDAARRELIFDLDMARRSLFQSHGKTPEFDALSKSVTNLLRMWADT
jgi:PKHD-type hydroxylase